jgi:hypothetical protein
MQHIFSKSQQFHIKGFEWQWSRCNFKQWTQKNNDKNDQKNERGLI